MPEFDWLTLGRYHPNAKSDKENCYPAVVNRVELFQVLSLRLSYRVPPMHNSYQCQGHWHLLSRDAGSLIQEEQHLEGGLNFNRFAIL